MIHVTREPGVSQTSAATPVRNDASDTPSSAFSTVRYRGGTLDKGVGLISVVTSESQTARKKSAGATY